MAWLAVALFAAYGAPPPGLDFDAGEPWEARGEALLDGPPGCWELVGDASWNHDFGRWGATRGDAVFSGRMVDGVWGEIRVYPRGEVTSAQSDGLPVYEAAARFTPVSGQVRGLAIGLDGDRELQVKRSGDPRVDPVNTVRDILGKLTQDVETWWVAWDEERQGATLLRQTVAGRRDAEVENQVFFPGGGLDPVEYDLDLVGTYGHTSLIPARVDDLHVRLRARAVDGVVVPTAEALRFRVTVAGIGMSVSQTLAYRSVTRCAVAAPADTPAP
jgi:hypothetical protein